MGWLGDAASWTWNNIGPGTFGPNGAVGSRLFGDPNAESDAARKKLLEEQAAAAGSFADYGEGGFRSLGSDADTARAQLQDIASGKLSFSREQLRQGNQQAQSAQRSFAASAAPQNAAMAARSAAMNMGRLQSGLSGQQALAGIAEQQAARQALINATLQQRQQELNAALGSRQNALTGYGAGQQAVPEKSFIEKAGPAIIGLAGLASDERLKHNVTEDDDDGARKALSALKAVSYDYKNEKYGKGRQFGIMAQDLERAGLKHAVIDTPEGKMVHGGKLAAATTALVAHLNKRVSKLEGTKK